MNAILYNAIVFLMILPVSYLQCHLLQLSLIDLDNQEQQQQQQVY